MLNYKSSYLTQKLIVCNLYFWLEYEDVSYIDEDKKKIVFNVVVAEWWFTRWDGLYILNKL